jgi:2-polyprenyl-3-methyl-5-hydroxy-6-metoxy-1,4-benzoquinol methylase
LGVEVNQEAVSEKNAAFWDELCGSSLARYLGITDSSPASLKKFDDWYFDYYPYLFDHIPFDKLKDKAVLEIGLGYGTVSQRLAETGADYTGLDIAAGPVAMVNHRLDQAGLRGRAGQGSILAPDFSVESFDHIVAIGCLHHTGNLKLAIEQCRKLLRPGGSLIFMVYYAYSYRRFRMATASTLRNMLKETFGYRGVVGASAENERAAYDSGSDGGRQRHIRTGFPCARCETTARHFRVSPQSWRTSTRRFPSRRCPVHKSCRPGGRLESAWTSMQLRSSNKT